MSSKPLEKSPVDPLGQIVTIEAMTEEILLEGNLTPAQYGKVWDNWDLADVARDLLDGWQSLRVKAQSPVAEPHG